MNAAAVRGSGACLRPSTFRSGGPAAAVPRAGLAGEDSTLSNNALRLFKAATQGVEVDRSDLQSG